MKQNISINQKPDQIIIKIAEGAEQPEIIQELNDKLKELKKIYKEEKTPIFILGKVLKNEEMEEIQNRIKSNLDVKIEFESPKELGLHGIKKTYEKEISTSETKYIKGSLRSGKKLEFEGSIIILGDVNGGAEVIASENIVVLGSLRGLAHAGAKGNKKAIIAAGLIEAPQLRISDVIKEISKEEHKYRCAFIEKDTIVLE